MQDDENENFEEHGELEHESEPNPAHRDDKIFNNRYNFGESLVEGEERFYSSKISVASDYADSYLNDLYDYEANLEAKATLDALFAFIKVDRELSSLLQRAKEKEQSSVAKIKFSKEEVNFFFNRVNDAFETKPDSSVFYNPIYVLEIISSVSSIEYRRLFDMLDTEVQEILLVELNKKYGFLEGRTNKKRKS
jgi:hypothetical protein